jgi:hypothetical protein
MLVARKWLSSRHVKAATDTHATTEELLEAVFSVRSVLRLYNEGQLPLWASLSSVRVDRGSAGRQLKVAEAGSWGRRQFGNPEKGKRPPLEAATKQRSEDRDWEH